MVLGLGVSLEPLQKDLETRLFSDQVEVAVVLQPAALREAGRARASCRGRIYRLPVSPVKESMSSDTLSCFEKARSEKNGDGSIFLLSSLERILMVH
jgi:hypothetical protein